MTEHRLRTISTGLTDNTVVACSCGWRQAVSTSIDRTTAEIWAEVVRVKDEHHANTASAPAG